ncbi:hypothetical protein [Kibdelosporangium phytohabitans]|uniref:Uncharacterized protein n=1 Tax=Kibdelosporangium phytohabitans TaxID=860235 RepID=A0A0N9HSR3_9PSEU|nr:hypothetical protein [Kibdelosporangium phytohabitans]ALG06346.1 hypothetical protein AOZ06_04895 [Kibdelosporangium phytohabitans]MBE1467483.1 hypothetical protein [Kibdelosporangium phytohabitans]
MTDKLTDTSELMDYETVPCGDHKNEHDPHRWTSPTYGRVECLGRRFRVDLATVKLEEWSRDELIDMVYRLQDAIQALRDTNGHLLEANEIVTRRYSRPW